MRYSASKIAALLGKFGAKQRTEAILEVWQRASPVTLRAALTRRAALRCGANPFAPVPVPRPIAALLAQPCATPTQVAERKAAVRQAITSALPSLVQQVQSASDQSASDQSANQSASADQSTVEPSANQSAVEPVPSTQVLSAQIEATLVEHCEREIHTDFGTRQESPVVARFAAQYGQRVLPDALLHCKHYEAGDRVVTLQGRVDGRLADGRVVEIKNRVRCLFRAVRDYERMQVQTYLELLDAPSAVLCEAYHDELAWHEVERDTAWWRAEVLEPLLALDAELEQLFYDQSKQDRLFQEA